MLGMVVLVVAADYGKKNRLFVTKFHKCDKMANPNTSPNINILLNSSIRKHQVNGAE